jgi:hydrogenase maturation protease
MAGFVDMNNSLVVGYGNTLRGDDGLGPHIVENLYDIAEPFGTSIHLLVLPQLDIILASAMYAADVAIFVDARADTNKELVKVEEIAPALGPATQRHTSHSISVPLLLRIALDWYGSAPDCYAVMPKGYDFSLGQILSNNARTAAVHATKQIMQILRSHMG